MYNNFRQASKILAEYPKELEGLMAALGLESVESFAQWHEEERVYLRTVHEEPIADILQMNYVDLLIKLRNAE
jgi:hypothetical protein